MTTRPMVLAMTGMLWVALAGCSQGETEMAASAEEAGQGPALIEEIEQWRKQRIDNLLKPDGWTAIIGMYWLESGRHTVGSAAGSDIQLASGPARIGVVEEEGGQAMFIPEPGVPLLVNGNDMTSPVELRRYGPGLPATSVGFDDGKGAINLIVSGGRRALRVYHADAPTRLGFAGLDYYPIDASWRIKGRFEPHPPGRVVPVLDVLGGSNDQANPGVVVFELDGREFRLEVIGDSSRSLSLMFADRTNGKGSYPSGRFLSTELPDANGEVVIDFNRTYTPPCAYTEFGTCLLPPPENRIDVEITAGEKTYAKAGSFLK